MTGYVQIAVNVPISKGVFDYSIPDELAGQVVIGNLVIVPFGKQTVQGVVLRFVDRPSVPQTKNIINLVDSEPVLSQVQIALAEWMANTTLAPLGSIVDLFLPPGLSQQADVQYSVISDSPAGSLRQGFDALTGAGRLSPAAPPSGTSQDGAAPPSGTSQSSGSGLSDIQKRLLKLLGERGPLRGRQIDRHFNKVNWRNPAQALVKRGTLLSKPVLPRVRVRPKFIRTAQLAVAPEIAEAAMAELGQKQTLERRQNALRSLMRRPEAVNVSWIYAESGCNLADLQELEERELIILRETEIWRDPLQRVEHNGLENNKVDVLTEEQQRAWHRIETVFQELARGNSVKSFLLHGVTGSGKTEIYIRAAQEAIRRGKQVLVLVPEIALTPQTVRRFLTHFPGQVGLMHSKLSDGERYDTWRRARAGTLKVIIGARSALFAPLPNPGLIVLDECHDGSYSQSEPPFYHAADAAQTYARLAGAVCILGSATPSVVQRYQAETGESVRLELSRRILKSDDGRRKTQKSGLTEADAGLPPVKIIDMREELKSGQRSIFSRELHTAIESILARGEQAILFLNRRGTATYVFCRDCGYAVKCPLCETPMTLHIAAKEKLLCHHCGYERNMPKTCPICRSQNIRAYGLGSEKVESEVQALFPKARTLRWDWETTRQKDAHEIILTHFSAHRADILVGTQMLAKGLDLPLVTLVGIVFADVGLNLPDPFSVERVFQILTQVAGRAGRSERGGKVILQTFAPEHYAIQAAARHDVNGFYQYELEQRKRLGFPPFARLLRFEYRHHDSMKAEKEARALAARLEKDVANEYQKMTSLIGPVPCFHAKLNGQYRWQIVLRGALPDMNLTARSLDGWRIEVEPISLL